MAREKQQKSRLEKNIETECLLAAELPELPELPELSLRILELCRERGHITVAEAQIEIPSRIIRAF